MALLLGLLLPALAQAAPKPTPRDEEFEFLRLKTAYTHQRYETHLDLVFGQLRFDGPENGPERTASDIVGQISFGINDTLTGEIEMDYRFLDPEEGDRNSGLGDTGFNIKWGLPRDWMPSALSVAIGGRILFPLDDDDDTLSSGHSRYGGFAALALELGPFTAHAHGFFEIQREQDVRTGVDLALEARLIPGVFSLYAALEGRLQDQIEAWSVVPGLSLHLTRPNLMFGIGVPIGMTDDAADQGVVLNVEWRI